MKVKAHLKTVSDDELLRRLSELLGRSRRCEADLVAHLGEVDARRLYAREAAPSMFVYCTSVLHLSEAEAWLRITAARATREHPMLLSMLRDGRLHLSGIRRLAPHLTRENRAELLKRATHRSRREIEELVAELAPRPDVPPRIRKLPERLPAPPSTTGQLGPDPVGEVGVLADVAAGATPSPGPALQEDASTDRRPGPGQASPGMLGLGPDPVAQRPAAVRRSQMEPLAPARYKVEFTADAELREQLQRLQALMRSSVPDGDLGQLIKMAVAEKVERLEAKRFAKAKRPRKSLDETDTTPRSRHIPAAVRRTVYERDEGRCAYVNGQGRRCQTRERLKFHHDETPFAKGGDHSPENIRLMCHAHNALLAEQEYGKKKMALHRDQRRRASEPASTQSLAPPPLPAGPLGAAHQRMSSARTRASSRARAPAPTP
jgi:hypothetical protein